MIKSKLSVIAILLLCSSTLGAEPFETTVVNALNQCGGNVECLKSVKEILSLIKPTDTNTVTQSADAVKTIVESPVGGAFSARKALTTYGDSRLLDVCQSLSDDRLKVECIDKVLGEHTQREERVGNTLKAVGSGLLTLIGVFAIK